MMDVKYMTVTIYLCLFTSRCIVPSLFPDPCSHTPAAYDDSHYLLSCVYSFMYPAFVYEIFAYRTLPMICSMTISGEISPPITMSKIAGDAPDTSAAPVSDRETGIF